MNTARPRLTLLTRPGCGLCEEFEAALHERFGVDAFAIEHADVDSRPDWKARYGLKIPVLLAPDHSLLGAVRFDDQAEANLRELRR